MSDSESKGTKVKVGPGRKLTPDQWAKEAPPQIWKYIHEWSAEEIDSFDPLATFGYIIGLSDVIDETKIQRYALVWSYLLLMDWIYPIPQLMMVTWAYFANEYIDTTFGDRIFLYGQTKVWLPPHATEIGKYSIDEVKKVWKSKKTQAMLSPDASWHKKAVYGEQAAVLAAIAQKATSLPGSKTEEGVTNSEEGVEQVELSKALFYLLRSMKNPAQYAKYLFEKHLSGAGDVSDRFKNRIMHLRMSAYMRKAETAKQLASDALPLEWAAVWPKLSSYAKFVYGLEMFVPDDPEAFEEWDIQTMRNHIEAVKGFALPPVFKEPYKFILSQRRKDKQAGDSKNQKNTSNASTGGQGTGSQEGSDKGTGKDKGTGARTSSLGSNKDRSRSNSNDDNNNNSSKPPVVKAPRLNFPPWTVIGPNVVEPKEDPWWSWKVPEIKTYEPVKDYYETQGLAIRDGVGALIHPTDRYLEQAILQQVLLWNTRSPTGPNKDVWRAVRCYRLAVTILAHYGKLGTVPTQKSPTGDQPPWLKNGLWIMGTVASRDWSNQVIWEWVERYKSTSLTSRTLVQLLNYQNSNKREHPTFKPQNLGDLSSFDILCTYGFQTRDEWWQKVGITWDEGACKVGDAAFNLMRKGVSEDKYLNRALRHLIPINVGYSDDYVRSYIAKVWLNGHISPDAVLPTIYAAKELIGKKLTYDQIHAPFSTSDKMVQGYGAWRSTLTLDSLRALLKELGCLEAIEAIDKARDGKTLELDAHERKLICTMARIEDHDIMSIAQNLIQTLNTATVLPKGHTPTSDYEGQGTEIKVCEMTSKGTAVPHVKSQALDYHNGHAVTAEEQSKAIAELQKKKTIEVTGSNKDKGDDGNSKDRSSRHGSSDRGGDSQAGRGSKSPDGENRDSKGGRSSSPRNSKILGARTVADFEATEGQLKGHGVSVITTVTSEAHMSTKGGESHVSSIETLSAKSDKHAIKGHKTDVQISALGYGSDSDDAHSGRSSVVKGHGTDKRSKDDAHSGSGRGSSFGLRVSDDTIMDIRMYSKLKDWLSGRLCNSLLNMNIDVKEQIEISERQNHIKMAAAFGSMLTYITEFLKGESYHLYHTVLGLLNCSEKGHLEGGFTELDYMMSKPIKLTTWEELEAYHYIMSEGFRAAGHKAHSMPEPTGDTIFQRLFARSKISDNGDGPVDIKKVDFFYILFMMFAGSNDLSAQKQIDASYLLFTGKTFNLETNHFTSSRCLMAITKPMPKGGLKEPENEQLFHLIPWTKVKSTDAQHV